MGSSYDAEDAGVGPCACAAVVNASVSASTRTPGASRDPGQVVNAASKASPFPKGATKASLCPEMGEVKHAPSYWRGSVTSVSG